MTKGTETRQRIVSRALELASTVGLEGLSIGELASALSLSKSGLFAHFGSKEALQLEVLQQAAERFVRDVARPAFKKPRGEPRVVALFERWLEWGTGAAQLPGGCVFITASVEWDDRAGPVRDAIATLQREWLQALARAARIAVEEGHFRRDLDVEQFAFDLHGIMLETHFQFRLLQSPKAKRRARQSFERLLEASRA